MFTEVGVSLGLGVVCLPEPDEGEEKRVYVQHLANNSSAQKDGRLWLVCCPILD